jgi:hypothetical protein
MCMLPQLLKLLLSWIPIPYWCMSGLDADSAFQAQNRRLVSYRKYVKSSLIFVDHF